MAFFLAWSLSLVAVASAVVEQSLVSFNESTGGVQLVGSTILVSDGEWTAVKRAADDLSVDFGRVSGQNLTLSVVSSTSSVDEVSVAIIAGTIGKSDIIDSLVSEGQLNVSEIKGEWESFKTTLITNPIDGVSTALVIAGSDKRGTIYGIYDISEQIGVSPWYYWADVPAEQHTSIYALNTTKTQGSPSVKYRGFFINDEAPALTNYINANYPEGTYGPGYNSAFYSKVFELLLRLRANYLWPAMWNSMFYVDDTESGPTASDEYGIVMGTSHTEPLMRASKEQSTFLNGDWSWASNKANVTSFMKEGVERAKDWDNVFTMGMRGSGDEASPTLDADSLEDLIEVQQTLLKTVYNTSDLSDISQMWCLYKEVGKYYQQGLQVPDDITLLWADDNWGNAQRLPLDNETSRSGGAGIYYHFDYVGDPRDYKWINTINLQKTWAQMYMAYQKNVRDIWIVNVGDIKPLELPINHFFDLAYDISAFSAPDSTITWLEKWAAREFGTSVASATAALMQNYSILAGRRKYEDINVTTYSVINYNEAETVLEEWLSLATQAQSIYDQLDSSAQPAFFEIVLHPCVAGYIVNAVYINAAKNNVYAEQRRTIANYLAEDVMTFFNKEHDLTTTYHNLLNGKWNHFMDQTIFGYDYWQQPMRNTMPSVMYVQTSEMSLAGNLGASVQGSNGSVPGDSTYNSGLSNYTLVLPAMDPYGPSTTWIDIFSKGTGTFTFKVTPVNSWVKVTPTSGTLSATRNNTDARILVSVDWDNAPSGSNIAYIKVSSSTDYGNYAKPQVNLPVNKTSVPDSFHGFVESGAVVSMEAEHATSNTSVNGTEYMVIPGYSRTLSSVALTPFTISTQTPPDSPVLEYDFYTFTNASSAGITLYLSTALNTNPSSPLKYAISIDDATPKVVQYVPTTNLGTLPSGWSDAVLDGVWKSTTRHKITSPQSHTLKLWAVEAGVMFQKIVIDLGGVKKSYMGPPESTIV